MCCPSYSVQAKFTIDSIKLRESQDIYHVSGEIDRSPKTFGDRVVRFWGNVEWFEHVFEIADESFHLFGSLLQKYSSAMVYQKLNGLHHAAHHLEHFLHAFCLLGDVSRLVTGKFFEYHDAAHTQLDYVRSAARVCHAVSHFFTTSIFLSELNYIKIGDVEKVSRYASIFSTLGYGIWAASLLWRRYYQKDVNHELVIDLSIHLGGFLFEAIPLTKTMVSFSSPFVSLDKLRALAGIIHAWTFVQRLTPKDREEVSAGFPSGKVEVDDGIHEDEHKHHPHEPCCG